MQKFYILFILLLFSSTSLFAQFPSETAFAYPATINIDGDLKDWQSVKEKYPINQFPYGNNTKNKEDFEAFFQVAYNKELKEIYFAITIQDQENIIDDAKEAQWSSQDTYGFYIDEKHKKDGSGVYLYMFNEVLQDNNDISVSWDKELRKEDLINWGKIDKKIIYKDGKKIIEFKVKTDRILDSQTTFGIDHMVIDKDANEDINFATWTNSGGKSTVYGNLGSLILLDKESQLFDIKGKLNWKTDTISDYPKKIKIYSSTNSSFWTNVLIDSLGYFEVRLPKGNYKVEVTNDLMPFEKEQKKIAFEDSNLIIDNKNSTFQYSIYSSEIQALIPQNGILSDGLSAEDEHKVDDFMRIYMEYYNVAGVSLALIDNGEIVFHNNYGYKNYSTKEPINKRTLFEGASTTKPMFAFAVMRLMEKGILDLDKPLYLYHEAPKDVQDDPNHKLITARMVLSHTTGFPNWAYMNPDGKLNIQFIPGTKYQYSGAGFEYLKDVVVKITGKDISTILKEEVLDVLEIENTYFKYEEGMEEITANGHFEQNPRLLEIPKDVNAAASLHTDPQSYAKFLIGILNRKGLKEETYKEMFKFHTLTSEEGSLEKGTADYFGLGLSFKSSPVFGSSFGHGGNNGDFKCEARIYEKGGKGFVIMTNSSNGNAIFSTDLYKLLITGKEQVNP